MTIVDLFAGLGGWDLGARAAGLPDPLGIEWNPDACATRRAVGLPTLEADVEALDPSQFAPVEGLIASPPCQDFSRAGRHAGVTGDRGRLVYEPVRWIDALRPRWVALEQVDNVLPIWEEIASRLIVSGYSTWAGILSAEEYGVPQTRRRAILLASLDRQAHPPAPTHQAYRFGEPAEEVETLFGTLRPWVSMAEALGWDDDVVLDRRQTGARLVNTSEAPSPTLTATAVGKGVWAFSRPSTTIAGDPRAFQPGSHHYAPGAQSQNALRLELSEGLILQGFPADYPVAGSTKRSRWLQVGNAVPPPLAAAILDTLTR